VSVALHGAGIPVFHGQRLFVASATDQRTKDCNAPHFHPTLHRFGQLPILAMQMSSLGKTPPSSRSQPHNSSSNSTDPCKHNRHNAHAVRYFTTN